MTPSRGAVAAAVVVLCVLGLISHATSGPAASAAPPVTTSVRCGIERWKVKTLQDRAAKRVDFHTRKVSIRTLRRLPDPHIGRDDPRTGRVERHAYSVRARLISLALEDAGDVHLVIADPRSRGQTMIAELPAYGCTTGASPQARRSMHRARGALSRGCGTPDSNFTDLHGTAVITGVGFWDVKHGQRGLAPNGIELHPVLGFRLTSSRC